MRCSTTSLRTIERTTAFKRDFKREARGRHRANYRDCHIRPDLVLIYRLAGNDRLILARLGSHSELDLWAGPPTRRARSIAAAKQPQNLPKK